MAVNVTATVVSAPLTVTVPFGGETVYPATGATANAYVPSGAGRTSDVPLPDALQLPSETDQFVPAARPVSANVTLWPIGTKVTVVAWSPTVPVTVPLDGFAVYPERVPTEYAYEVPS